MNYNTSSRLAYLDIDTAVTALTLYKEQIPESLEWIEKRPDNLQTHYSLLAMLYGRIALFSYALRHPLSEVREAFFSATGANLKVFELRGTEAPFEAYNFTYDPSHPAGTPESTVEFEKLHAEEKRDYSLTNSQKNYIAVCQALIAGEDAIADQLAAMIWDPPKATYIGPRSFCTPNDQHLAYAVRELFQDNSTAALSELDKIKARKASANIGHEATMVRALITRDPALFVEGLTALLTWHGKKAPSKTNFRDPEFFICMPGLALCRLSVRLGVCTREHFPEGNVFLPLDLLPSATDL